MLYIVGTYWYPYDPIKPLPNDEDILYPENIRVINHELFSDLIGFQGKVKEHFEQIIDLNYNTNIGTLKKIHELNNIKWNNTNQLREILKEKELIKNSINDYFKIRKTLITILSEDIPTLIPGYFIHFLIGVRVIQAIILTYKSLRKNNHSS